MSTIIKDLGAVSAYAYAVEKGYTGTEAEFAELMADYADVGQRAEDAADSALNSKTAAQTAAQTATTKASEASTSATSASSSASAASASASQASGSATSAANSATAASGSATSAAGSATTASIKASEASASATGAATAKTGAEAAQTAAETAQGKAEDAQEAAETTAQSISASAAQIATNTADITQLKSEVSALPTDGVVANSKQLLSENGTDNTEPYMFRAVPVNADRAELDAVVGGTVNFNQLIKLTNNRGTSNGITFARNSDGTVTANGTATGTATWALVDVPLIGGHTYVLLGCPSGGGGTTFALYANQTNPQLMDYGGGSIKKQIESTTGKFYVIVYPNTTVNITFVPQLFDLTTMFGLTIADYIYSLEATIVGTGVAKLKEWGFFTKDYYPYDSGTLKSVEGVSSHNMVGFNQWDEEWEVGGIKYNTGQNLVDNSNIRSKNYIPVFPNTAYYVKGPAGQPIIVCAYDADKNFVKTMRYNTANAVFNTNADNICYIRFCTVSTPNYGNTYKNDICINFSDPNKNGTYEPYVKHSYPLDSTLTLRGIPKLADGKLSYDGDRYLTDGTVKRRYGIVDLGTLTWQMSEAGRFFCENASFDGANDLNGENLVCSNYIGGNAYDGDTDKCVSIRVRTYKRIWIKDSAYTNVTAFNTAMSGVYLVYELATPTTETADPYQSLQVCDPNGTEEFVSTGIVPVGHETRYPENLRAKIEGLPWDFSSLIAPTEKTTTASRNYTTGSLLIMNNVLYKVTANIANGGTITPDTNVTATTLSEVISALQ